MPPSHIQGFFLSPQVTRRCTVKSAVSGSAIAGCHSNTVYQWVQHLVFHMTTKFSCLKNETLWMEMCLCIKFRICIILYEVKEIKFGIQWYSICRSLHISSSSTLLCLWTCPHLVSNACYHSCGRKSSALSENERSPDALSLRVAVHVNVSLVY